MASRTDLPRPGPIDFPGFEIEPGDTLVDVGCGDGTVCAFAGHLGADVVGLDIRSAAEPERRLLYIPGCAALPDDLLSRIAGVPLLLFDGSFWHDDEMRRSGAGTKTAARMGHIAMDGPSGSIAALRDVEIGRRIFVHINNTNPVLLDDSPERASVEAAGWDVAEDGMEIIL